MSIKDYAIGKVNKWLGSQGYTVAKKTPRKRTATRTTTKTTTKKKATVSRKANTPLDKLIINAKKDFNYLREIEWQMPRKGSKDYPSFARSQREANKMFADSVLAIARYYKAKGANAPLPKIALDIDDAISKGRSVKLVANKYMPKARTKTKTTPKVTNAKLQRAARYR